MQNMILSVGPGTPASVLTDNPINGSSEGSDSDSDSDDSEGPLDAESRDLALSRSVLEHSALRQQSASERAERALMDWMDFEEHSETEGDAPQDIKGTFAPSIRHGGCINTACWLTSPWRLSLREKEVDAIDSQECPTQIITSGDDRLVKFWDVRHAMGSTSPLAGGRATITPFSSEIPVGPPVQEWSRHDGKASLPGSVIPLATIDTRHQGNVFHVTPLDHSPGKVVTCAADGYLRMSDLESGTSAIVVSPEHTSHLPTLLSLRPGMCFSHHFLDTNTGLLCSERGLRRFDLRTSSREQSTRSLLGDNQMCKTCAIWSADDLDSSYVFCGGSSAKVCLYDLRMTDSTGSRIVQLYLPRDLPLSASVSVSGLDLSKDKRELLVSYENDQIYAFPIFPNNTSTPTVDELNEYAKDHESLKGKTQSDLASFGGHLNRYTFLKNAKYAGPNDEYVCTGSDSGHAWIYERATGTVASFLNADHSTCNGVIPHPSLPFFITYGIDSTAKLWRATLPVDHEIDDSPLGRARRFNQLEYESSPVVNAWCAINTVLSCLSTFEDKSISVLPDFVPRNNDLLGGGIMDGPSGILFRSRLGMRDSGAPFIGNDLRNLPEILSQNIYTCIQSRETGDDDPIRSSLSELNRRISVIRMNHQAAQRGLISKSGVPWLLEHRNAYVGAPLVEPTPSGSTDQSSTNLPCYGSVIDLIPEYPGDWIPFDAVTTSIPKPCGFNINLESYGHMALTDYDILSDKRCQHPSLSRKWTCDHPQLAKLHILSTTIERESPCMTMTQIGTCNKATEHEGTEKDSLESDASVDVLPTIPTGSSSKLNTKKRTLDVLQETVELLKDGGNAAFKDGSFPLAARRYDQALQYCAVAFMSFPYGDIVFMNEEQRQQRQKENLGWSPLLKSMISVRLNLSMVLLKAPCRDPKMAGGQAKMALFELGPFCVQKGVTKDKKGCKQVDMEHDGALPDSSFKQAKELQAKALFRLGSVFFEIGDYSDAVKNFEASIKCTRDLHCEPESIVLRRLAEAKRGKDKKTKQQRKRFKAIFSPDPISAQKSAKRNTMSGSESIATNTAPEPDSSGTQGGENADSTNPEEFRFDFSGV